jgi:Protein of unknown function (DUF4019)
LNSLEAAVIPRQYRIHIVLMLSAALMIILPLINEAPDTDKAEAATAAATEFLGMLDADQYDRSWQSSAKLLQERVSLDEWTQQLRKIRAAVGPVVDRTQSDISYATTATDSPEGEYVQIFYETRSQVKEGLEETVTVMLEADGQWRVAGYFVK